MNAYDDNDSNSFFSLFLSVSCCVPWQSIESCNFSDRKKKEREVFETMWIKKMWEKAEEPARRIEMERGEYMQFVDDDAQNKKKREKERWEEETTKGEKETESGKIFS